MACEASGVTKGIGGFRLKNSSYGDANLPPGKTRGIVFLTRHTFRRSLGQESWFAKVSHFSSWRILRTQRSTVALWRGE